MKKPVKVIHIDARNQKVSEVMLDHSDLSVIQNMVGGEGTYVEPVRAIPDLRGAMLLVDEDGIRRAHGFGFTMDGHRFSGNGVLATLGNTSVRLTCEEVLTRVGF